MIIFIGLPLFSVIVGAIFYEMVQYIKPGRLFFTLLFLGLMVLAVIAAIYNSEKQTKGLIIGIVLITGLLIAFLLTFFATHPKIFMDKEDLMESEEN